MSKLSRLWKRFFLWLQVLIWIAVIYLTLPYARVWSEWLARNISPDFIPLAVVIILLLILFLTIAHLIRQRSGVYEYFLLTVIVLAYAYSISNIEIAVVKVHFLEYGFLAFLLIRAFRLDHLDSGQYLNSILVLTLIGIIDEFIQGQLVNRVGELYDILLNILSGLLALCWYRLVIHPQEMKIKLQRMLKLSLPLMGLIIFMIGAFNSRISEFGYYIEDGEIGAFYSRLSPDKLGRVFPEVEKFQNEVIPRFYRMKYDRFLHSIENRLHGEIMVHVFRRDKHLRDGDYITAYRENQILEKYFEPFILGTELKWSQNKKEVLFKMSQDRLAEHYLSPVSSHLITKFHEQIQWTIILILELLLFGGWGILISKNISKNN
jgi:VanZ family protein